MPRKTLIFLAVCFIFVSCTSGDRSGGPSASVSTRQEIQKPPPEILAESVKYEKKADRLYARLAKTRDLDKAFEIAGRALEYYKKAIDLNSYDDKLVHKYCLAIEMAYNLILPDDVRHAEKQKAYAETLALLERVYPGKNKSIYADYDMALMLILNTQYFIVFQVFGAVNKIYGYCEEVCVVDKGFADYSALGALGRINYLAPNIPFLMPWPDKKISKKYLEEAIKGNPGSLLLKLFLADTLQALGEKDRAAEVFRAINSTPPRDDMNYFQDQKAKRECVKRMKELSIK